MLLDGEIRGVFYEIEIQLEVAESRINQLGFQFVDSEPDFEEIAAEGVEKKRDFGNATNSSYRKRTRTRGEGGWCYFKIYIIFIIGAILV